MGTMAKKDRYWRMLVAAGLLAALACSGCAGRDAVDDSVDHGGSLVSEEGQIAFTHAPNRHLGLSPRRGAY
jgi:hypothetical protein